MTLSKRTTVSVSTKDLRRAFEFYRDGLGLELATKAAEGAMPEPVEFLLDANTHLMLVPTGGFKWVLGEREIAPANTSECVLGLSLSSDAEVDQLVERVCKAGAEVNTAPAQKNWGYCATIRDPDGHVWLFIAA
jgi:uncharacterized protein